MEMKMTSGSHILLDLDLELQSPVYPGHRPSIPSAGPVQFSSAQFRIIFRRLPKIISSPSFQDHDESSAKSK
jgi:hypothetical protein